MNKQILKSKLMDEIDRLPEDKIDEFYNIIHYVSLGLKSGEKKAGKKKNAKKTIVDFFGIWKDISTQESKVFEEIQSRRNRTLRQRNT